MTLDGTVIHKSGSITGGQSSQGNGRKWNDEEVAGASLVSAGLEDELDVAKLTASCVLHRPGLSKQRESLMTYLEELRKTRPATSLDDGFVADITRLDGQLVSARDDLVSPFRAPD